MPRAPHHLWMLIWIRQGRSEHESIVQWMFQRVSQVGPTHRSQILARVLAVLTVVEMPGERIEGSADDLRQQVVAARKMLVRRLMGDSQAAGHLSQAQPLDTRVGDDGQCFADATLS